jgi:Fe-Mn family superoxide dismutase
MNELPSLSRRAFGVTGALALGATLLPKTSAQAAAVLPPLPYGFDALVPHIDAKTMEIHHGKHHAGYVSKLNTALEADATLAGLPLGELQSAIGAISDTALQTAVRNNGGGHWNHSFFWESLAPASDTGAMSADLAAAITAAFGDADKFKEAFGAAAAGRFGSGWAWLVAQDGKLIITSTPNQDNPLMNGIVPITELGTPLLGLDVWEHAYYLEYQNRRPEYVAAWWNIVNWNKVSERFAAI